MAPSVVTVTGDGHCTGAEPSLLQAKATTTSVRCHPLAFAAGATLAVIERWVLTTLTVALATASLPARSTAVPVIVWVPSAVTGIGAGQDAMPEPVSAHVNVTVALVSTVPSANGAGDTSAVMVGGVVSRFTVTAPVAVLPAWSVAVPLICCAAPCDETVTGDWHVETPDRVSLQAKLTATSPRCQPAPFAAGAALPVTTGADLSMLSVTLASDVRPALSVIDRVTIWLAPSLVTVTGAGQLIGP